MASSQKVANRITAKAIGYFIPHEELKELQILQDLY